MFAPRFIGAIMCALLAGDNDTQVLSEAQLLLPGKPGKKSNPTLNSRLHSILRSFRLPRDGVITPYDPSLAAGNMLDEAYLESMPMDSSGAQCVILRVVRCKKHCRQTRPPCVVHRNPCAWL